MRVWEILMGLVSISLAIPVALILNPFPNINTDLGIPKITPPTRFYNYTGPLASIVNMLGDFAWGTAEYLKRTAIVLTLPPAIATRMGAPSWLVAIISVIVGYAFVRAMIYMVAGRNIDYA
mgnify:FL=1